MSTPKLYAAIYADLKSKYPKEAPDRIASVAAFLYSGHYARFDAWGRVEYRDDPTARKLVPHAFNVAPSQGDYAAHEAFLASRLERPEARRVRTPDEVAPKRRAPTPAEQKIAEAEALEARYAAALAAGNRARDAALAEDRANVHAANMAHRSAVRASMRAQALAALDEEIRRLHASNAPDLAARLASIQARREAIAAQYPEADS